MKQLTIRGFDAGLEREIRRVAREEGISLNKAVIRLLRRGASVRDSGSMPAVVGSALDHLAGTWTAKEARAFELVEKDFEQIDADLWS